MKRKTIEDQDGRKQEAYEEGEMTIPIGPPSRIVDVLGYPEPFATNLHNALHARGLLSYADVRKNPQSLQGALQEVLMVDVQKLTEAFYLYEKTEV